MKETGDYKKQIMAHHDKYASIMSQAGPLYDFKLSLVKKYLTKNSRLLDLGCGNGLFTIPLSYSSKGVMGVDFSRNMIFELNKKIKSKKISNITVQLSDFSKAKIPKNSFDVAVSFSTLYYVKELDRVLSIVKGSLKPEGVFIFDMLNRQSLGALHYSRKYSFYQNFSDLSELKSKLEHAGFEVIEEYRTEIVPPFSFIRGILDIGIAGKTLDFILSNLYILKGFAFRIILVCKRVD